MRLIISESEKNRIKGLYEQDRDPSNADSQPDLDELFWDDYWEFPQWQTWFNANVSKYGKSKAQEKFVRSWAAASEGFEDGEENGMDEEWLKSNGLWNSSSGEVYTPNEFFIASQNQNQYQNKLDNKSEVKSEVKSEGPLPMIASPKLKPWLKCEEGSQYNKCEPNLVAYRIPGETSDTVGYGHHGEDVAKLYKKITRSKAEQLLDADIEENSACVNRILQEWKDKGIKSYAITQGQFDAMVSFAFNAGCTSLRTSKFIQQTKVGNHNKAAELIKNENVFLGGHESRREKESNMYLNGQY